MKREQNTWGWPGWNDKTKEKLRRLWDQKDPQLTTAQIGQMLGCGKDAAVNQAHRMLMTPRPSPIKKNVVNQKTVKVRRLPPGASTLPPLGSISDG